MVFRSSRLLTIVCFCVIAGYVIKLSSLQKLSSAIVIVFLTWGCLSGYWSDNSCVYWCVDLVWMLPVPFWSGGCELFDLLIAAKVFSVWQADVISAAFG